MIMLNSPVWKRLTSAGSHADGILQDLLEGRGEFHENMENLGEDLSHQLSWYSATSYALPHLAALCPRLSKADKVYLVAQMGAAIAAESVEPLKSDTEAFHEFHEGLDGLRQETVPLLTDPEVHAALREDAELGVMFALGALAIVGDRRHAYDLWYLSYSTWEEGPGACACGWEDETISFLETPEYFEPAEIGLWDRQSLEKEAVWLNGLLSLIGDEMISPILPLVYGTGICPECGKREPYWSWMDRFAEEC